MLNGNSYSRVTGKTDLKILNQREPFKYGNLITQLVAEKVMLYITYLG